MPRNPPAFRSITTAVAIIFVLLIAVAAFVGAIDIFLLTFLAVMFGVSLTKASQGLGRWTKLPYGWNLGIITTTILALVIGAFVLLGMKIESQVDRASDQMDKATKRVRELADDYPTFKSLVESVPFAGELLKPNGESSPTKDQAAANAKAQSDARSVVGKATEVLGRVFGTTFGLLTNLFLIVFVSIFIASQPSLYKRGVILLFPPDRRDRVEDVMNQLGDALWNWLVGQSMTMTITGVGTGIALWLLGVPMAMTLGIVTALLTFIPNFGAITSLALAVLFALPQGLAITGWVIVVYLALQFFESNIITPLIQQHQVSVPPALLITFQLLMGALFGFLGILVATPFLATLLVLVRRVYIEDYLGDDLNDDDSGEDA